MRLLPALALLAGAAGAPSPAAACPPDPSLGAVTESLRALPPAPRMAFIRNQVEHGAHRARAHTLGWAISLAILSVGQFALLPAVDREARPDFIVGGVGAGIGALSRVVFMPAVIRQRRRLARVRGHSCAALAQAERALAKSAKSERSGRHVGMHLLTLGYNAAVGIVLGVPLRRPIQANVLASAGNVIGELMLITQPRTMVPALARYRAGVRLTLLP